MCDDLKLEDTCLLCNKKLANGAPCTDHGDNNVKQYECLFCDVSFSRQASMVWHLKTIHDYKCNINPNKSPSGSEHNYYERPKCTKCKIQLRNAYELEKHLCGRDRNKLVESSVTQLSKAKKSAESPVTQCNKVKKSAESPVTESNKREKNVESLGTQPDTEKKASESPVTHCITCNKDFASDDAYRKHLSKYVTKYRPFYCCICQTTFSRKRSLVFHLYIHKRSTEPESKVSRLSDIPDPPRVYPYVPNPKVKKTTVKQEVQTSKVKECSYAVNTKPKKITVKQEGETWEPRAYAYVSDPKTKNTLIKEEIETEEPVRKSARISAETSKQRAIASILVPKVETSIIVPKEEPLPNDEPLIIDLRDNELMYHKSHIIDVRNNALNNQKCGMCQKKFKKVLDLEKHLITYHHAPLAHKCSLCPEGFVLKASLLNHAIKHIF